MHDASSESLAFTENSVSLAHSLHVLELVLAELDLRVSVHDEVAVRKLGARLAVLEAHLHGRVVRLQRRQGATPVLEETLQHAHDHRRVVQLLQWTNGRRECACAVTRDSECEMRVELV